MAYSIAGRPLRPSDPADAGRLPASAWFEPCTLDLRMVANRSALPKGTNLVLIGFGLVMAAMSLRFVLIGAWPVLVFSALDLTLLVTALHAFRRTRPPEERLTLVDGKIVHLSIDDQGREQRLALPAYWTKLDLRGSEVSPALALIFRNHRYPIGLCLAADERRAVAGIIANTLAAAR
ncbi:DUF2244 domain-containing protein [Sphingopyxis sp. 550A]